MIANTFRELAVKQATKQSGLVNALLEESPFLAALPMEATTHGLQHVYEEIVGADSASIVDLDEALPEVDSNTRLRSTDLRVLGAIMTVGEDKAKRYGGPAAYFDKKSPLILKATGADMEKALLYNTFRNFAIANHTAADPKLISAGGAASKNFSILAIHFASGEVTGLYDEAGFGTGKAFDIQALSGGKTYLDTAGRVVYGVRMKTYFGTQLANPRYVSAIVNIEDSDGKRPTAAMLDGVIEACRGRPENTLLVMHPRVKAMLQDLKGGLLTLENRDNGVDRRFQTWNGVEILDTYNFLRGTEAAVVVA